MKRAPTSRPTRYTVTYRTEAQFMFALAFLADSWTGVTVADPRTIGEFLLTVGGYTVG